MRQNTSYPRIGGRGFQELVSEVRTAGAVERTDLYAIAAVGRKFANQPRQPVLRQRKLWKLERAGFVGTDQPLVRVWIEPASFGLIHGQRGSVERSRIGIEQPVSSDYFQTDPFAALPLDGVMIELAGVRSEERR